MGEQNLTFDVGDDVDDLSGFYIPNALAGIGQLSMVHGGESWTYLLDHFDANTRFFR